MRGATSGDDHVTMQNWYYNVPTGPAGLASLTSRQRSERASWRTAARQAIAEARRQQAEKATTANATDQPGRNSDRESDSGLDQPHVLAA